MKCSRLACQEKHLFSVFPQFFFLSFIVVCNNAVCYCCCSSLFSATYCERTCLVSAVQPNYYGLVKFTLKIVNCEIFKLNVITLQVLFYVHHSLLYWHRVFVFYNCAYTFGFIKIFITSVLYCILNNSLFVIFIFKTKLKISGCHFIIMTFLLLWK